MPCAPAKSGSAARRDERRAVAALGYRNGVKRVAPDGVPLWRDGTAPFSQSLYYRGTWAALALLTGLGSVSLAVFGGGGITLAHIVIPALLCVVGTLFALWQILLVVMAARRGTGSLFALSAAIAAATAVLIGSLLYDRAVPALTELWNIRSGDAALGDLAVTASSDGRTLYVSGAYGMRSEEAVRRALEQTSRSARSCSRGRAAAPRWASRSSA